MQAMKGMFARPTAKSETDSPPHKVGRVGEKEGEADNALALPEVPMMPGGSASGSEGLPGEVVPDWAPWFHRMMAEMRGIAVPIIATITDPAS